MLGTAAAARMRRKLQGVNAAFPMASAPVVPDDLPPPTDDAAAIDPDLLLESGLIAGPGTVSPGLFDPDFDPDDGDGDEEWSPQPPGDLGIGTTPERLAWHQAEQDAARTERARRLDFALGNLHTPPVLPRSRMLAASRPPIAPLYPRSSATAGRGTAAGAATPGDASPRSSGTASPQRAQRQGDDEFAIESAVGEEEGLVLVQLEDEGELEREERERAEREERELRARAQRDMCDRLYREAHAYQQRSKELSQRVSKQLLSECTFTPKLNTTVRTDERVEERNSRWLLQRQQRLSAMREAEKDKDLVGCTFKPKITPFIPETVFARSSPSPRKPQSPKTQQAEEAREALEGSFVARLQRARQMREMQKDEEALLERKHTEGYTGKPTKCNEFKFHSPPKVSKPSNGSSTLQRQTPPASPGRPSATLKGKPAHTSPARTSPHSASRSPRPRAPLFRKKAETPPQPSLQDYATPGDT